MLHMLHFLKEKRRLSFVQQAGRHFTPKVLVQLKDYILCAKHRNLHLYSVHKHNVIVKYRAQLIPTPKIHISFAQVKPVD